jgi:hypothetical protein
MVMRFRNSLSAGIVLCLASVSNAADGTIDLRDCPLDTVVFIDPWAGQIFKVKRVGTDYSYICEDGFKPPSEMCRGPFGDLVLEGERSYSEDSPGETMYATWSVIAGVPCCDWYVHKPEEMKFVGGFKWLEPKDVPLLREQPWLSIDSVNFGSDFGNPLFAVSCTMRK